MLLVRVHTKISKKTYSHLLFSRRGGGGGGEGWGGGGGLSATPRPHSCAMLNLFWLNCNHLTLQEIIECGHVTGLWIGIFLFLNLN